MQKNGLDFWPSISKNVLTNDFFFENESFWVKNVINKNKRLSNSWLLTIKEQSYAIFKCQALLANTTGKKDHVLKKIHAILILSKLVAQYFLCV